MHKIHGVQLGAVSVLWMVDELGTAVLLRICSVHKAFRIPPVLTRIAILLLQLRYKVGDTVAQWDRQCQLHALKHTTECARTIPAWWGGEEVKIECGRWHRGQEVLCPRCLRIAKLTYPQGWSYYPGDRCEHGVYVGGCGVDHMCARCEYGV